MIVTAENEDEQTYTITVTRVANNEKPSELLIQLFKEGGQMQIM